MSYFQKQAAARTPRAEKKKTALTAPQKIVLMTGGLSYTCNDIVEAATMFKELLRQGHIWIEAENVSAKIEEATRNDEYPEWIERE